MPVSPRTYHARLNMPAERPLAFGTDPPNHTVDKRIFLWLKKMGFPDQAETDAAKGYMELAKGA